MSLDVYLTATRPTCVYDANITHNLGKMAKEAGIYKHLWRPEELGITKAQELIAPLTEGLTRLLDNPEKYKALNPDNGWGTYDGLIRFVDAYIQACQQNPDAEVSVSK